MPFLEIEDDRVVIRLSTRQALMALARQVSVPLTDIRTVAVVADGWDLDLGWRVGGTEIPRRLAFGRFRQLGGDRTFAALYAGRPALVLETTGGDWDRVAVVIDDADLEDTAARVREAAGLS